jgi:MFS family permease
MSAQAIGGLLGGLVVGYVAQRLSLRHMIGWGAIAFGLIDLAIFNYPAIIPGVALGIGLMVLVGIPGALAVSALDTLLQTATQDAYRGRVFGALGTTQSLLMLLGAVLAGALGDQLGTVALLNVQGFGFIVAGGVALATLGATSAARPAESSQPVAEGI